MAGVAVAAAAPAVAAALPRSIFVTGGNSGIGLALCKALVKEDGCRVFLGSRSLERGEKALKEVQEFVGPELAANVELVQCDTASDGSVQAAAAAVETKLGSGGKLYAVVNNAGTGLEHGTSDADTMNVNVYGTKRVTEAFGALVQRPGGRLVIVGSGAGPGFVRRCTDKAIKNMMVSQSTTWEELDEVCKDGPQRAAIFSAGLPSYGLSKAALTVYAIQLAKENPELTVSCLTPGFIDTALVKGWGATKLPEEGLVSLRFCLFQEGIASGWFWGSDAKRSPPHFMRNPGQPEYDGAEVKF